MDSIQWFPGHMAKTRKILEENIKLVDVVTEILDARIPLSSKNPLFNEIIKGKPVVLALNKSDLSDIEITKEWEAWYASKGYMAVAVDSISGKGIEKLKAAMRAAAKSKLEKDMQRGRIFRPLRTMVIGIPNVGKSTLINKITRRAGAVTGDKPGITRGKQWIRINPDIELLDTPGMLRPKLEDFKMALNLAAAGAIRDEAIDIVEVAAQLLNNLKINYALNIEKRFGIRYPEQKTGEELLKIAGLNRGCIASGGEVDLMRIAAAVLDDFRGGKMGRISLERPD